MNYTILYERLDGSSFVGSIFHPQMEVASVKDPLDGKVKTFKTRYTYDGIPFKRVEMEVDANDHFVQV